MWCRGSMCRCGVSTTPSPAWLFTYGCSRNRPDLGSIPSIASMMLPRSARIIDYFLLFCGYTTGRNDEGKETQHHQGDVGELFWNLSRTGNSSARHQHSRTLSITDVPCCSRLLRRQHARQRHASILTSASSSIEQCCRQRGKTHLFSKEWAHCVNLPLQSTKAVAFHGAARAPAMLCIPVLENI
ncbi:hypothetical protein IWX90DRAFT_191125 [Phyllosticta citrichinensis]|uniref:Uncharacterized protein n=1 Tax=Phyllosticta citrichinensis TaxID=1130410 RepID=A0ABR1XWU8_9PEZI